MKKTTKDIKKDKKFWADPSVIPCLPQRGDIMTQHTKIVLDRWVFRAIWVVLFVTTTGFVAKMLGVM